MPQLPQMPLEMVEALVKPMRRLARWLGSPVVMRHLNGWATVFWVLMIPVSLELHWLSSVTYVAALSIWALVSGHLATWQSARIAAHQADDANVQEVLDIVSEDQDHGNDRSAG
jgi:hypothetical protein